MLSLEIIEKKIGERSETRKVAFLTTKYEEIAKSKHFVCPKVRGGGHKPTFAAPTFESARASAPAAPPPSPTPLGYLLLPNRDDTERLLKWRKILKTTQPNTLT